MRFLPTFLAQRSFALALLCPAILLTSCSKEEQAKAVAPQKPVPQVSESAPPPAPVPVPAAPPQVSVPSAPVAPVAPPAPPAQPTVVRVPVEPALPVPPTPVTPAPAPSIPAPVPVPSPVPVPVAVAVPVAELVPDGPVEVKAPARRTALPEPVLNRLILRAISDLPKGGGYAVNRTAMTALRSSLLCDDSGLILNPRKAQPSFCSGATYLVFVQALAEWHESARRPLSPAVLDLLLVKGQADGTGVWGRWNANGPGTARLFTELGMGVNFQSLEDAQPGDFLKLWWNEHVGKREFGHSVIYLGLAKDKDGSPGIRFWSSNQPDGYGEKVVPFTKVKRLLLSRLTRPDLLATALPKLPKSDKFLAEMLTRDCSARELAQRTGMPVPRDEASADTALPSGVESASAMPQVPVPVPVPVGQ